MTEIFTRVELVSLDVEFLTECRPEIRFQTGNVCPEILLTDAVTSGQKNVRVEVLTMTKSPLSHTTSSAYISRPRCLFSNFISDSERAELFH